MSLNKYIHIWEIVKAFPEKPWDWRFLSRNPSITMEIIEANLDLPWDLPTLSRNPNITASFIKKHKDYQWDWDIITSNKLEYDPIVFKNKHSKQEGELDKILSF